MLGPRLPGHLLGIAGRHRHPRPALEPRGRGLVRVPGGVARPPLTRFAARRLVTFQNCVQSTSSCRLGVKIAAVLGRYQGLPLMGWPWGSQDVHPRWIWASGPPTSSNWGSPEAKYSIVRGTGIREAWTSRNRRTGQRLNHILKNNVADALNDIEMVCRRSNRADAPGDVGFSIGGGGSIELL